MDYVNNRTHSTVTLIKTIVFSALWCTFVHPEYNPSFVTWIRTIVAHKCTWFVTQNSDSLTIFDKNYSSALWYMGCFRPVSFWPWVDLANVVYALIFFLNIDPGEIKL